MRMRNDEKIKLQREKQSSYQETKKKLSGRLGGVAGGNYSSNFHSPPDKD
jgi:hypothetical protein